MTKIPARIVKEYILRIATTEPWDASIEYDYDALEDLPTAISHAEDAVNDQLPDGYYCKIEDA